MIRVVGGRSYFLVIHGVLLMFDNHDLMPCDERREEVPMPGLVHDFLASSLLDLGVLLRGHTTFLKIIYLVYLTRGVPQRLLTNFLRKHQTNR